MTVHPLDPLTAEEIDLVRELLASTHSVGAGWRYASIEAVEPAKPDLAAYADGGPLPPRRAEVVCFQRLDGATYRARVDLSAATVESFEPVPGVQPSFTIDEWEECDAMLRRHPDVVAALAGRGITDLSAVFIDTWTYGGALVPEAYAGRRRGWRSIRARRW